MAQKSESDYRALAEDRGFEWLGPVLPRTVGQKTLWRCSKGHIFPRHYSNLRGPARQCPICNGRKPRIVDEFPEQVKMYFDPDRNPEIEIEFTMSGSSMEIEWLCPVHTSHWPGKPKSVTSAWKKGESGCPSCSGKMKKVERDYHALASRVGISWIGGGLPNNTQTPTLWTCKEGHIFPRDYGSINFKWTGCPVCKGGKPRLLDEFPNQVGIYFDPDRNPDIKIDFIMSGSNKQIVWYCAEHHREWSAGPNSIVRSWSEGRSGCSVCSGTVKRTKDDYRALAKERDLEWLGPQLPESTGANTLWRCFKGHIFPRYYSNLSGPARECPICNGGLPRLIDAYPEQVAEYFDRDKNPEIAIEFIMSGSSKTVEWYCREHDRQWPAPPSSIYRAWSEGRSGCSVCSGTAKRTKDDYHALAMHLEIVWLGKKLPLDNKTKTDWRCDKGHEFPSTYNQLSRGHGCLYCAGRLASSDNNLHVKYPGVAKLWHPSKNGETTPNDVVPGSHDEYWWQCSANPELHEWEASVKSVVRSNLTGNEGCPFCSGHTFHREESLGAMNPELIPQWHPTKNGDKTPFDFSYGSGQLCYWKCTKCGHEWQASPNQRTSQGGKGCSKCSNQTSRLELRFYAELSEIFKNIEWRRKIDGKECDLFLPDYDFGIEIDGAYWHSDKLASDRRKNIFLERRGIHLLRVREQGLPRISDSDVFYTQGKSHLATVIAVVGYIKKKVTLSREHNNLVAEYIERKKYWNDKGYRRMVANLPAPPEGSSFADEYPDAAKKWDSGKNAPLLPTMFTSSSHKKVYWLCGNPAHAPFRISIKDRVAAHKRNGTNCKQCRDDKKWAPSPEELRKEYMTMLMGDIAKKHGVSRGTVRNRMIEYGITRRRRPGPNAL